MKTEITVVRPGIANRLLVYWIPLLILFLFWRNAGQARNVMASLFVTALALVFVILSERYLFGFRLTLMPNQLIYRDRGPPWVRERIIQRDRIRAAKFESAIRTDRKPWTFVELVVDEDGRSSNQLINLVAFRHSDIRILLDWLEINDSRNKL